MNRDFDLIRKLLIFFEQKPTCEHIELPSIEGYDESTISYHLVLLHDAGLLRCEPIMSSSHNRVIHVIPFELTWEGHEFLDKIRSDSVWQKIREVATSRGGSLAFAVINQLATRFALQAVCGMGQ